MDGRDLEDDVVDFATGWMLGTMRARAFWDNGDAWKKAGGDALEQRDAWEEDVFWNGGDAWGDDGGDVWEKGDVWKDDGGDVLKPWGCLCG